nr:MAG TPA: hypothetical protein [Caudoviricetes sp.]
MARALSLSRRDLIPRHTQRSLDINTKRIFRRKILSIHLSLIPSVLSEPFTPYRRYTWF